MKQIFSILVFYLAFHGVNAQCNQYSLSFDSSSYVSINDHASLRLKKLTISLHFKTTSTSIQALLAKANLSNGNNFQYGLSINHNAFSPKATSAFSTAHNSNCMVATGYSTLIDQNGDVPLNVWQNVVYTYDGISQKFYLNGILKKSTTTNKGNIDSCAGGGLLLGINFLNAAYYFVGKMDEVAVYNRALSNSEVISLYNNKVLNPQLETGLVAYYRFEAGTGTNVTDLSGNGNHGTIVGCTWSNDVPFTSVLPDIKGPVSVHSATPTATYTTSSAGPNYKWTISGGSIISGQGNDTVTVNWGVNGPFSVNLDVYNDTTCKTSQNLSVNVITGAGEIAPTLTVSVYPNPVSQYLNIQTDGPVACQAEVFNLLGMKVWEGTVNGTVTVGTMDWSRGIYHVVLSYNNFVIVKKVARL